MVKDLLASMHHYRVFGTVQNRLSESYKKPTQRIFGITGHYIESHYGKIQLYPSHQKWKFDPTPWKVVSNWEHTIDINSSTINRYILCGRINYLGKINLLERRYKYKV